MARPVHKKLIVPGDRPAGLGLLIPTDAAPKYRCRVPTGPGETCGHPFYEGEERAWIDHISLCARNHEQEIHDNSPRVKMPIFYDPEQWDPEYETFMREVGRRMRAEGRVEQRPNEH